MKKPTNKQFGTAHGSNIYKLLGKTCGDKTLSATAWEHELCPGGEACPAIIEEGDDTIIVIGKMRSKAEVRMVGLHVGTGYQAVQISRQLLLCSAEEMFLAARKSA